MKKIIKLQKRECEASPQGDCFVRLPYYSIFLAMTVIMLLAISVNAADEQYPGGKGAGWAMGESKSVRLDGKKESKNEIASVPLASLGVPRNDDGEFRNDGAKPQYHGGPGAGWAMGESSPARLDGKKESKNEIEIASPLRGSQ